MITSKLLNRIKAVVTCAAMTVTALAVPVVMPEKEAEAAGSDNYAKLLQHSLYFYDANMCGKIGSSCAIDWRGDCHTGDEVPGGFHDAGDHAMFGLPQGYTASTLGWSYYEFKDAYNATGQAEHYKIINDHFCDFFRRSTKLSGDSVQSFLYQKEDGNTDHAYWGAPEKQEQEQGKRKMYWTSNSASDIAADYAAALALSYINFGNAEDLKYAEALYKFSTQHNSLATDGPTGFYLADGATCKDEQAWAAGWLYIATKKENYKNDCAAKQTQYLGWVHGWNTTDLGAACVYAEITNDWSKVNGYIGSTIQSNTQNGYFFMDKWGSARYNCSMQMTALVASKHSSADYTKWCKEQMNYITGNNPTGVCFVTGFESNSAKNTHHRAASGYQGYDGPDGMGSGTTTYHPSKGHVLVGALAGGPEDSNGTYQDVMNNYVSNEVAIDYNAGLVGAAAGLYSVYKSGSTSTSIPGVSKIYSGSINTPEPTTTPTTKPTTQTTKQTTQSSNNNNNTTASTNNNNNNTTTTTTTNGGNNSSGGAYEIKPNYKFDYNALGENERMIGWKWADFGLKAGDKPTKVEVSISANGTIGKWEGAFGSSTTQSPDYWTMTDQMSENISGNSGTITWNIDSATQNIIQTQYNGEVKFGTWWIDCKQFTIDSVKVYTGSGSSNQNPVTTQTTKQTTQSSNNNNNNTTTTTTTNGGNNSSGGAYEIKPNYKFDYNALGEDERMIGWKWADFGLKAGDKPTKVEVSISANGTIGKWEGAFGSSTKNAPDYWTMTDQMSENISGNSGTITWNIDSATQNIIQTQYNGEVKFGTWWIDCKQFTIDSVKVYTGSGSSNPSTTATTKQTTNNNNNNTTTTKTTTNGGNNSNGAYEIKPNYKFDYNALGEDERMIGWKWADFGLKAGDKPAKVEVSISANGTIGKWEGAFGSSTKNAPDYWTMTDQMSENISGNSGTITWNIDSATQNIIQTQYNGEVKFGTWWIDCKQFTIDSVKVYTAGGSSSVTTTKATTTASKATTTKATTTTTSATTTKQTTNATTTTKKATTTTAKPTTGTTIPAGTKYGDVNDDGLVNVSDVVALNMYILNPSKNALSSKGYANADCKRDNVIDMSDSAILMNYVAELIGVNELGK